MYTVPSWRESEAAIIQAASSGWAGRPPRERARHLREAQDRNPGRPRGLGIAVGEDVAPIGEEETGRELGGVSAKVEQRREAILHEPEVAGREAVRGHDLAQHVPLLTPRLGLADDALGGQRDVLPGEE